MRISSTVSSSIFFVSGSGNVGIGTTTPDSQLVINGSSNSRFNMRAGDTRYGTLYADNGVFAVASITSIPLVFGTNDVEKMRITSGGNVGIGTTNPTTYSLAGRHFELNDAGGGYSFYHCNTTTVKSFLASNEADLLTALFTFSNHALTFGTNNTERMRITSGGNVGVGTGTPSFSNTGVGLNVQAASGDGSYLKVSYSGGNSAEFRSGLTVAGIGNVSNNPFQFLTNNTERMRITSGGNVLIGTTTDTGDKLQINGENFQLVV
jgi:uncharacterized protein YaiE (UPF0345 family)